MRYCDTAIHTLPSLSFLIVTSTIYIKYKIKCKTHIVDYQSSSPHGQVHLEFFIKLVCISSSIHFRLFSSPALNSSITFFIRSPFSKSFTITAILFSVASQLNTCSVLSSPLAHRGQILTFPKFPSIQFVMFSLISMAVLASSLERVFR